MKENFGQQGNFEDWNLEIVNKILFITRNDSIQKALANKIFLTSGLDFVVLESPHKLNIDLRNFHFGWVGFRSYLEGFFNTPFRRAWHGCLDHFSKNYSSFPIKPILEVSSLNTPELTDLIRNIKPNLVIVSGTSLLNKILIDEINLNGKILNLHTGISPYIRGGPNCTNWCLALNQFHLIGNTVMWLNKGIDAGNIIASEQTALTGNEKLSEIQVKVITHGQDLVIRTLRLITSGAYLKSIEQKNLGAGSLFLTKNWNFWCKLKAILNYVLFFRIGFSFRKSFNKINLVELQEKHIS